MQQVGCCPESGARRISFGKCTDGFAGLVLRRQNGGRLRHKSNCDVRVHNAPAVLATGKNTLPVSF